MPLQVLANETEPVRMPLPGNEARLPDTDTAAPAMNPEGEERHPLPAMASAAPEQDPAPVPEPEPAAVLPPGLEPAAAGTPQEPLTDADTAAWSALFNRLFDVDCTEVNILANDPVDTEPYHVVVNVGTRYYHEPYIAFESEASLRRVIERHVLPNAKLDVPRGQGLPPIVDGTFLLTDTVDGITEDVRARIQILSPPATYRTEVHFCKLPKADIGLEELVANDTMPADVAYYLSAATKAGLNMVFSGIPNTGKTTVLNACTFEIPGSEKVAVIQDVDELTLPHLRTKQKLFTHRALARSIDSISDGSASALIEVVKRTRPARLLTGECRSGEMYDHLEASAIFHGCMTTVHASNAAQALDNMQNMALKNKHSPGLDGIRALIATGVDLVVQLGMHQGRRVVTEVLELDGTLTESGTLRRTYLWQHDDEADAWVKGSTGPCERSLRKLARASQPDYWHNPPRTG
jgi:Flp pilus assembly CpaF family ATPase